MNKHTVSAAASLEAYRAQTAFQLYGECAGEILRARIGANVDALVEHEGHLAVLAYSNELLAKYVAAEKPKLSLAVSNTAEIVKG